MGVTLICIILHCLVGGFSIRNGIQCFKNGHYFLFGVDIMVAVWMAAGVFKFVSG